MKNRGEEEDCDKDFIIQYAINIGVDESIVNSLSPQELEQYVRNIVRTGRVVRSSEGAAEDDSGYEGSPTPRERTVSDIIPIPQQALSGIAPGEDRLAYSYRERAHSIHDVIVQMPTQAVTPTSVARDVNVTIDSDEDSDDDLCLSCFPFDNEVLLRGGVFIDGGSY